MALTTRTLRDDADRILVLRNPKAGAGASRQILDGVIEQLRDRRYQVDIFTDLDQITEETERLNERGELRTVLAAGGDGTAEVVVNRIPLGTPLSILPLGTENLLAKYLGVTGDPVELANAIENGVVGEFDLGRLTAAGR